MDMQFNQEYIEGETPNYSIEELNDHELNKDNEPFQTHAIISKAQHGVPVPEIEDKYEEIINKYEYKFMPIREENYNEKYDKKFNRLKEKENILKKYNDLKAQVDLIEKDLNFYKENKDKYKSIVPIETSIEELNKVKYIINYIESSRNLEKFKKIDEIQQKFNLKVNEENYDILNKKLFKDLNEQLDDRLNKMNKLKNENPSNINNFEYELFLSPAKEKIDQLKQLDEVMININKIEEKIGKWNFNNKKNTIVSMLEE